MAKQQGSTKERTRIFTHYPKHYKVLMHNDDFTEEAERLMLQVHEQGIAVVGIYSYDMALSMINKATSLARDAGHPLRITYEPE